MLLSPHVNLYDNFVNIFQTGNDAAFFLYIFTYHCLATLLVYYFALIHMV